MDIKNSINPGRKYTTQPLIEQKTPEVYTVKKTLLEAIENNIHSHKPPRELGEYFGFHPHHHSESSEMPKLHKALQAEIEDADNVDFIMYLRTKMTGNQFSQFMRVYDEGAISPAVMAELKKLRFCDLAEGIDRGRIINKTLENIQNPESIDTLADNTSSERTVQAKLAKENPAEYVRIIAELASTKGEARLQDGSLLTRTDVFQGNINSITDNLMQYAMEQKVYKDKLMLKYSPYSKYGSDLDELTRAVLGDGTQKQKTKPEKGGSFVLQFFQFIKAPFAHKHPPVQSSEHKKAPKETGITSYQGEIPHHRHHQWALGHSDKNERNSESPHRHHHHHL